MLYEVITRHYKTYQAIAAVRSVNGTSNELFASAMASIKAKDYQAAIDKLETLVGSDATNIESTFMLGVANMEIKQFDKAETSFQSVVGQNDNLFMEDASWYLGLCYMMTGENDKALRQFEVIAASKSKYNKEARRLARKID